MLAFVYAPACAISALTSSLMRFDWPCSRHAAG